MANSLSEIFLSSIFFSGIFFLLQIVATALARALGLGQLHVPGKILVAGRAASAADEFEADHVDNPSGLAAVHVAKHGHEVSRLHAGKTLALHAVLGDRIEHLAAVGDALDNN